MNNLPIKKNIILILALLAAPIGQIAMDMYLPSLPAMSASFHVDPSLIQYSLTAFVLSYGLSMLFYGPLSDSFGRRDIVLTGFFIFTLGSLLCLVSPSVKIFMVARVIQGLGAGCSVVATSAMLGDIFSGGKLARVISYTSLAWSISPILAPFFGGLIQQYLHWRDTFLVILVYSLIYIVLVKYLLPETLAKKNRHPFKPKIIIKNGLSLLGELRYLSWSLCAVFSYGGLIAFSIEAPFILQLGFKVTPAFYGILVLLVGVVYSVATFINSQLVRVLPIKVLLAFGSFMVLLAGAVLLIFVKLNVVTIFTLLISTSLLTFGQGFIYANCMTKIIVIYKKQRGMAVSFFGTQFLMGCGLVSAIVAKLPLVNVASLAWIYLAFGLLTVICFSLILYTERA